MTENLTFTFYNRAQLEKAMEHLADLVDARYLLTEDTKSIERLHYNDQYPCDYVAADGFIADELRSLRLF